jgi:hypothetical protein
MSDKASHVRFYHKNNTYYAEITDTDGTHILLDLGPDEESMKKVVKILEEEFGGIRMPPGGMN